MKKILIINVHSYRNAGDAALADMVVRLLRESFKEATLTLAMDDPGSYAGQLQTVTSFMGWFKSDNSAHTGWRWFDICVLGFQSLFAVLTQHLFGRPLLFLANRRHRETLTAYLDADFVVSCAGNFLYSSGKLGLAFFFSIFTLAYAWMAGKPLYLMPQSFGPFTRFWEKALMRWIISKMHLTFVREPVSWEVLQSLGAPLDHCILVPDIAFAFPAAPRADGMALLSSAGFDMLGPPSMGVTVVNWQGQSRAFNAQAAYEEAVAEAIRSFISQTGGRAVIFSQVCGPTRVDDDRIPARRVYDKVCDLGQDRVLLVDRFLPPALLKSVYGLMDVFLGTRLHSNVFALGAGVPVVAIAYQYKTRGVMRMLGLESWVVDIEQVTGPQLRRLMERAVTDRAQVHRDIQGWLPDIVQQITQVGSMIAMDVDA